MLYKDIWFSATILQIFRTHTQFHEHPPNFMNTQFPSLSSDTQIEGEEIIGIRGSNKGPKTGWLYTHMSLPSQKSLKLFSNVFATFVVF
jgi:hypothetical protein